MRRWRLIVLVMALLLGIDPAVGSLETTSPARYLGVDLSYVNEMEDCGGQYRAQDERVDPFALFSQYGANLVRVRLWHTPTWTNYSTFPDVKKTIARAKAQGMATLLDFHYSDTWADPSKQIIPAAWAEITDVQELAQVLYDYTFGVLAELDQEGLMPELVQVGNEINTAILRGENESGYPIDWERNATLLNAAIRAVRDAGARSEVAPRVMLHIAKPEEVEGWLLAAARSDVSDYDIVGISYYPGWSTHSISTVGELVTRLRYEFGKEVMIAETAYPWTLDGVRESAGNILGPDFLFPDYPATPTEQKQFLVDLTQTVLANGGLGVIYWEPAWISTPCYTLWGQGSHWENATFFDFRAQNNVIEGIEFLSYPYQLPVEVTFQVTLDGNSAPEGVYFWGNFTEMGRKLLPMQESGEAIYRFSARLMPGQTVHYAFYSGPNRRENQEVLPQDCANSDGLRTWMIPDVDTSITHVFGSCAVN